MCVHACVHVCVSEFTFTIVTPHPKTPQHTRVPRHPGRLDSGPDWGAHLRLSSLLVMLVDGQGLLWPAKPLPSIMGTNKENPG